MGYWSLRRGVAQPGSARRSGRRGPRFESGRPDYESGLLLKKVALEGLGVQGSSEQLGRGVVNPEVRSITVGVGLL